MKRPHQHLDQDEPEQQQQQQQEQQQQQQQQQQEDSSNNDSANQSVDLEDAASLEKDKAAKRIAQKLTMEDIVAALEWLTVTENGLFWYRNQAAGVRKLQQEVAALSRLKFYVVRFKLSDLYARYEKIAANRVNPNLNIDAAITNTGEYNTNSGNVGGRRSAVLGAIIGLDGNEMVPIGHVGMIPYALLSKAFGQLAALDAAGSNGTPSTVSPAASAASPETSTSDELTNNHSHNHGHNQLSMAISQNTTPANVDASLLADLSELDRTVAEKLNQMEQRFASMEWQLMLTNERARLLQRQTFRVASLNATTHQQQHQHQQHQHDDESNAGDTTNTTTTTSHNHNNNTSTVTDNTDTLHS